MRRRRFLAATGGAFGASVAGCVEFGGGTATTRETLGSTTVRTTTATDFEWSVEEISLPVPEDELYRAAGRDAIPAIVDPVFGADWRDVEYEIPDENGESFVASPELDSEDEVLGVVRDGEPRAYPLKVLDWHEVVNDAFAEPLVVTYCPVCRSGVVADRRVRDTVRTFGVSGYLFRANLVLYDQESGSLWGQLLARAIRGPLTGTRLSLTPSTVTTWGAWRDQHPETGVLLPPPFSGTVVGDVRYNYEIDVYGRVRDIAERYPDYGPLGELPWGDARLRRRAIVIGVVADGTARAYPLSAVMADGPVNDVVDSLPVVVTVGRERTLYAYERRVAGTTLEFRDTDEDAVIRAGGSRWTVGTGKALDDRTPAPRSPRSQTRANCTGRLGSTRIRTPPSTASTIPVPR